MSSMTGSRGAAGNNIPKGYAAGKIQQFTPEAMNLYRQQFGLIDPQSQIYQQAMGSDQGFAPYENLANRKFQEFSGQNASRFSGMGLGARHGSGFQNLQTQGAQDFASQLAMQRQQLQRQALLDLSGISNTILGQQPEENFLVKKELPFWQQLALGAVQGGGQGLASGLSGGISSLFQRKPQQPGFQQANY